MRVSLEDAEQIALEVGRYRDRVWLLAPTVALPMSMLGAIAGGLLVGPIGAFVGLTTGAFASTGLVRRGLARRSDAQLALPIGFDEVIRLYDDSALRSLDEPEAAVHKPLTREEHKQRFHRALAARLGAE